jgi:enoyl-CoA hydratase/carnithine racemase
MQGKVATITLCRPSVANRLAPEDLHTIQSHLDVINQREEVLVLRFKAVGKYFCSGYDIASLGGSKEENAESFGDFVDVVERARPVTIAAINGGIFGGATDLSLACDFRIAVSHAEMFMPAARLGLHFYRSGMERYVNRLGLNAAKYLFLTCDKLDSQKMLEIGFVTEVVESDRLDETVEAWTDKLAAMAPIALLGMKKHLNRIARNELDPEDLARDISRAEQSQDLKEALVAWKEKRKPVFTGN